MEVGLESVYKQYDKMKQLQQEMFRLNVLYEERMSELKSTDEVLLKLKDSKNNILKQLHEIDSEDGYMRVRSSDGHILMCGKSTKDKGELALQ